MSGRRGREAGLSAVVIRPCYEHEPSDTRVEAELAPLAADPLIESREEPTLVGGGIEMREVRFV